MSARAEPLAERILCALEARLAEIAEWDGYRTSAGLRVYRARRTIDEQDLPCVVLWDDGESATKANGASRSMSMTLRMTVEGHIAADQATTGRQLGKLRADIKRALLRDNGWVGDDAGKIGVLTYADADTDSRNDGALSECTALHFDVNYKETYGDPTTSC